ncbi:MAG TPA: FixH family protein [Vicinamibacterales bacterium]|nr:FixH family protein [Vicinamibacterales bacterium]
MRFAVALPWWGYALAFASAVALAVHTYGGTRLAVRPRFGLTALRALTLVLLVAAVLRPVRVVPPSAARSRVVPVLVDVSRSMRVADATGPARMQRARSAAAEVVAALEASFRTEVWAFGDGVVRADLDDMQASAGRSDLRGALRAVADHYRGRSVGGIVVVSDGGDTSSRDAAADVSVPVFTVGVGQPRLTRDREIVAMSAGEPRLADSTVDVQVSALSTGFGAQPLELTLTANGRPVDVRRVAVTDGAPVSTVFTVSPDPGAPTVYRIEVPVAPGEVASENNTRSVLVEPPGRRRRLLIVEGAPGYEYTFLKRALARDSSLDVDSVIRKGQTDDGQPTFIVQAAASRAPTLAAGYPRTRADLFVYDAVVFGNVDAGFFSRAQLEATAAFVSVRGGGLLVMGGRSFEREGLSGTPLDEVLPVDMSDRRTTVARAANGPAVAAASAVLTGDGAGHPATRIGASADESRRRWAALPPLASTSVVGGPRPGALVLATTAGSGGDVRPLVAVQRYGQGRAMVFAGEASWRWRMMLPAADTTYDAIWRQVSRWLARGTLDAVSVAPIGSPSPGTTEVVSVLVRDADFAPVSDAEVQVQVAWPGGAERRITAVLIDAADGRYTASVPFGDAGVYRVTAEARRGGTTLGIGDRGILAGGADPEMADPRLNEPVLQRLAEQTGGLYVRPDEVDRIPPRLQAARVIDGPPEFRDLWHGAWSLLAVIVLLAAEWGWRRRVGLA